MNTFYNDFYYRHPNGQVTKYDLQEVQHGSGPRIYVASESASNQGPGFEAWPTRDAVAHDASARIQRKDGVEPEQVRLYQQKPDGDFDRVDFRSLGRDAGVRAADGTDAQTRDAGKTQDWSECHRETQSREEVRQELQSDLFAAPETPQQFQQRQNQEYRDLSAPQGFNRSEVTDQEKAQLQAQVDRTQEQSTQEARTQEQSTQNQNQNQQDQEAQKHAHSPRY